MNQQDLELKISSNPPIALYVDIINKENGKKIGSLDGDFWEEGVFDFNLIILNFEYRGKGINPIAYKLFKDLLKSFGVITIYGVDYLIVERNSNFWERMGFKRTGETRTYFDDYAEDEEDAEIEVPEIAKQL